MPHKNDIKLNNKEPIIAPKKLVTLKPGTIKPARANKNPLSITVKIPKVNILNGKVINSKTGFKKVFIIPITAAVITSVIKPSVPVFVISNPFIVLTTKNNAIALIIHLIIIILKLNL